MPDADVKLMIVNYELTPDASEPELILGFVAERTGESLESCVVDYRAIRASEEQTSRSALVAVARREAVLAYLELLRGAGLKVEALEIAPIALHRLFAWLGRAAPSGNQLVLHCGRRRSHLIALAGRRLDLYREVEFGADGLIEALSKSLDLGAESAHGMLRRYGAWPDDQGSQSWEDPAEAFEIAETLSEILKPCTLVLAEEVKRAGVYMASQWQGASLERVSLLGGFAEWPRIDRLLESAFAMPTRVLDPLTELSGGAREGAATGAGDEMSIAAGLALRGMAADE
jgi:type IV pilus assembly protein PilM